MPFLGLFFTVLSIDLCKFLRFQILECLGLPIARGTVTLHMAGHTHALRHQSSFTAPQLYALQRSECATCPKCTA
eukprot:m.409139 g.409139  ORF g.409139 m.409139 type:complete len:75 (+) comp21242_c0_seq4:12-236(+)